MKHCGWLNAIVFCLALSAFLTACAPQNGGGTAEVPAAFSLSPDAVVEVVATERSQIETTASGAAIYTEAPEVIVTGALQPAETQKTPKADTTPEKNYYTVKFVDSDGYTALSVQSVEAGQDAVPPRMPGKKDGLSFQGWNKSYTNISQNMIVTAIYAEKTYTVSFYDANGMILKETRVPYGGSVAAPEIPRHKYVVFDGWSEMADEVTADISTYAMYALPGGVRELSLKAAYEDGLMMIGDSIAGVDAGRYFHNGEIPVDGAVYTDVLCGNFQDRLTIANFGFSRFTGTFVSVGEEGTTLSLTVECDGKTVYTDTLDGAQAHPFSVRLAGVGILRIKLETYKDGVLYESAVEDCLGGIADGKFES